MARRARSLGAKLQRMKPPIRSVVALAALSWGAAVVVPACSSDYDLTDPEEAGQAVAEAFCGLLAECCDESQLPGGSESDCFDLYASNFAFAVEQQEKEGYPYDPRCVEVFLATTEQLDCSFGLGGTGAVGTCGACAGFNHGSKKKGETCEDPRDCDFGLVCAGTCIDPCGGELGEACGSMPNGSYGICAQGYFCQTSEADPSSGTCAPLPGRGDACPSYQCAPGLACVEGVCDSVQPIGASCRVPTDCSTGYCDTTDPTALVCAPPPGAGEPCSYACDTSSRCVNGICEALPREGMPCPDSVCAAEAICDDGVCTSVATLLCSNF
jgi:hypothetical protein